MDNYVPKEIPEGINNPQEKFGKEFLKFTLGTVLVVGMMFVVITLFVNQFAKIMPESWDKKIRQKVRGSEQALFVGKKIVDSKYLYDLLRTIDPEWVQRLDIQVRVVCSPQVNAFATLGGEIYVLDGFLQNIQTENELVMVLGHELGHFAGRHHYQSLGTAAVYMTMSMLLEAVGIDSLMSITPGIIFGKFSQSHELESDHYGIQKMNQLLGHIGGYHLFFDKLLTIDLDEKGTRHPGEIQSWFSTHPYPKDRNQLLKSHASKMGFTEKETTPLPAELKAICKPGV